MKKLLLFLCCIIFAVIGVLGFNKERLLFFPKFFYTNIEAITNGENTQGVAERILSQTAGEGIETVDGERWKVKYIDTKTVDCIGKGTIYCKKDETVRAITEKIVKVTDVR